MWLASLPERLTPSAAKPRRSRSVVQPSGRCNPSSEATVSDIKRSRTIDCHRSCDNFLHRELQGRPSARQPSSPGRLQAWRENHWMRSNGTKRFPSLGPELRGLAVADDSLARRRVGSPHLTPGGPRRHALLATAPARAAGPSSRAWHPVAVESSASVGRTGNE